MKTKTLLKGSYFQMLHEYLPFQASAALPRGATGFSAVCDCGIS